MERGSERAKRRRGEGAKERLVLSLSKQGAERRRGGIFFRFLHLKDTRLTELRTLNSD